MAAMSGAAPRGVGETAIGAAMMRGRESRRADPLFEDPLALAFVDAAPPVFEDGPSAQDNPELAALEAAFQDAVSVRTRFYDDFVLGQVASGSRQVALLGAGLDSRAFRLTWPADVRLFEVDAPDVLAFKGRVLSRLAAEPGCERVAVSADLGGDWRVVLRRAGFRSSLRTAWIVEGLIPYLTDGEAQDLLVTVGELSSAGSALALDLPAIGEDSLLARARAMKAMEEITSMWKGGTREDVVAWLRHRGWQPELIAGGSLAVQYRRMFVAAAGSDFVIATRPE